MTIPAPQEWLVEQADQHDADAIAALVLASAPVLLSDMLGEGDRALTLGYLCHALAHADGQYGYQNHQVVKHQNQVIGVGSAWHNLLPANFDRGTLRSLHQFFGIEHCAGILQRSVVLSNQIAKPKNHQLIIGHLSTHIDFQRLGIAKVLIQSFIQQAKALNKREVIVDVERHNQAALTCYLNQGFSPIKVVPTQKICRLTYLL